jgi:hypothetical protein
VPAVRPLICTVALIDAEVAPCVTLGSLFGVTGVMPMGRHSPAPPSAVISASFW